MMTSLTLIALASMDGTFPTELGSLTAMQSDLGIVGDDYKYMLSKTLPTELGRLTALAEYFEVSANEFTGTLPSELGAMSLFTECGKGCLSDMELTGTLPTELGQWTALTDAGAL